MPNLRNIDLEDVQTPDLGLHNGPDQNLVLENADETFVILL